MPVGDEKVEDDIAPNDQFDKCNIMITRAALNKNLVADAEEEKPPAAEGPNYDDIQIYLVEKDQEEESKEQTDISTPCKLVINQDTISMKVPYPFKKGSQIVVTSNIDEAQSPKINQKY